MHCGFGSYAVKCGAVKTQRGFSFRGGKRGNRGRGITKQSDTRSQTPDDEQQNASTNNCEICLDDNMDISEFDKDFTEDGFTDYTTFKKDTPGQTAMGQDLFEQRNCDYIGRREYDSVIPDLITPEDEFSEQPIFDSSFLGQTSPDESVSELQGIESELGFSERVANVTNDQDGMRHKDLNRATRLKVTTHPYTQSVKRRVKAERNGSNQASENSSQRFVPGWLPKSCDKPRLSYRGRRETQDRREHLSHTLVKILRHTADGNGLSLMTGGYLYVDDLLRLKQLKNYTIEDIQKVVNLDNKDRFTLSTDEETLAWKIKANRGHSLQFTQVPGWLPKSCDKPRLSYRGRRETQDRREHLSRTLVKILRHTADGNGLSLMTGGYLYVDDLLRLKQLKNYTIEDIQKVVNLDNKDRFTLSTDEETLAWKIKANRGHSLQFTQVPGWLPKSCDKPRLSYRGRRETQDRREHLSHTLVKILRHTADGNGLSLMTGGYLYVDDLLRLKQLKDYTIEDIQEVVNLDNKDRFTMSTDEETLAWKIKANRGHSLQFTQANTQ